MGHEPKLCLLLQLLPIKGGVEQGKEWGLAVKFPVLKLFRTGYGEGISGGPGKALGPSVIFLSLCSQVKPGALEH